MENKKPFLVYILLILLFFLSMSAILGGGALTIDPSGTMLGMPLEMLRHSPFSDFLIPGLFLLVVLGIFPLITFYGLIRKPQSDFSEKFNLDRNQHWSHTFSYYTGLMLILWIDFEVMFLRSVHMLHLIYSLLGVTIVALSQIPGVRGYYRKHG